MIKTTIEFLGHALDIYVHADEKLVFEVDDKSLKSFRKYLQRVLPYYDNEIDLNSLQNLGDMIQKGFEVEERYNIKLTEPRIKVPYDVPITVKEKVALIAEEKSKTRGEKVSQTQAFIEIVEKKYAELFGEE